MLERTEGAKNSVLELCSAGASSRSLVPSWSFSLFLILINLNYYLSEMNSDIANLLHKARMDSISGNVVNCLSTYLLFVLSHH